MQTKKPTFETKTNPAGQKVNPVLSKAWLIHHPYALVCLLMAAIVLYNLPDMPFLAVVICGFVLYAVPFLIVSEIKSKVPAIGAV